MTRRISRSCIALAFIVLAILVFTYVPAIDAGPPPRVHAAIPDSGEQETTALDVTIEGDNFDDGSTVAFWRTGTTNPGGVDVTGVVFHNKNKLVATIDIPLSAEIDNYDIEVTTSRGRRGKGIEKFRVVEKGNTKASDIRVCSALANPLPGEFFGIVSDDSGSDPAPYCHDLINRYGIYAYFQHEEGETSDLWVNLVDSERVFSVDFGDFLIPPDPDCIPSAWTGGGTTGWRFFVDEVDNVPVGTTWNVDWTDFCGTEVPAEFCGTDDEGPFVLRRGTFWLDDDVKNVTFELRFQMADWQDFDVNVPSDTSYLKVYHPEVDTWVIKPEIIATDAVVTLLRNGKGRNNTTSCGQFSMPFELTVWPI